SSNLVYAPQYWNNANTFQAATPVSVTTGLTTSGISPKLVKGGNITGKVTNGAGTVALAGIDVTLYDSSGNFLASTSTDGTGAYTFAGNFPMATGKYEIGFDDFNMVYLSQFYNGQAS